MFYSLLLTLPFLLTINGGYLLYIESKRKGMCNGFTVKYEEMSVLIFPSWLFGGHAIHVSKMCSSMRHVSKKPNIKTNYENIDISRLIGV